MAMISSIVGGCPLAREGLGTTPTNFSEDLGLTPCRGPTIGFCGPGLAHVATALCPGSLFEQLAMTALYSGLCPSSQLHCKLTTGQEGHNHFAGQGMAQFRTYRKMHRIHCDEANWPHNMGRNMSSTNMGLRQALWQDLQQGCL